MEKHFYGYFYMPYAFVNKSNVSDMWQVTY